MRVEQFLETWTQIDSVCIEVALNAYPKALGEYSVTVWVPANEILPREIQVTSRGNGLDLCLQRALNELDGHVAEAMDEIGSDAGYAEYLERKARQQKDDKLTGEHDEH